MTDSLLSNLRSMGRTHDDATVAHEAADEIERLRDALSNIREQCERHPLFMGNDASIDEILAVGGDAAMITEIAQCARQALGKRP